MLKSMNTAKTYYNVGRYLKMILENCVDVYECVCASVCRVYVTGLYNDPESY